MDISSSRKSSPVHGQSMSEKSDMDSVSAKMSPILPRSALIHLSQTLCSLASRQQNRSAMLTSGILVSLIRIVVDCVAKRNEIILFNRSQTGSMSFPTEEYGPAKLERLQKEEEEESMFLNSICVSCLNAISYFVSDSITSISNNSMNSANGMYILCI